VAQPLTRFPADPFSPPCRTAPGVRRIAAAALALVLAMPASGQVAGSAEPGDLGLGRDPDALRGYALAGEGKHVAARELAERMLATRPQSFEAHFLLGYVLHVAEANLPLAYHHLLRAREIFEKQYGKQPPPHSPWRWHLSILEELASVAREMDRFEETLSLLDAHDAAYDPDEIASRGWPLMRLRRYGEARAIVARALATKDPRQAQMARTTLCAIEAELQRRQPAYEACVNALRAEANGQAGPHLYTNAASSALSILKADEAERVLLEGTKRFELGNAANPWQDLALLYVDQGRTGEALSAVREMVGWARAQPGFMDDQTRAGTDFTAALFLLVAGRGEDAVRVTERILARPDRTGFTSAESAQAEAANGLLGRAALRLAAERQLEEASYLSGMGARSRAWAQALRLRFLGWRAGRHATRLLGSDRMLVSTLRPYLPGGISIPSWLNGDLVDALGAGVVAVAAREARQAEDLPRAQPFLDAVEAEAALGSGDTARARALGARALEGLHRTDVLLQARVAAVVGQALDAEGDTAGAARSYARALQQDPGVLRRLGVALPARIESDSGPLSRTVAERLGRSPRLRSAREGFVVQVQSVGAGAQACLVGPNGENLGCGGVARATPGSDGDTVAEQVCRGFHEQVFAARVDLTQADLRSLDGSTTVARERSERKLDGVLGELGVTRSPGR
jgi:tetratricopeptide (TPR) repeat protein